MGPEQIVGAGAVSAVVALIVGLATVWASRRGSSEQTTVDLFGEQRQQLSDAWTQIDRIKAAQAAAEERISNLERLSQSLRLENWKLRRALRDVVQMLRDHFGDADVVDLTVYGLDPDEIMNHPD